MEEKNAFNHATHALALHDRKRDRGRQKENEKENDITGELENENFRVIVINVRI